MMPTSLGAVLTVTFGLLALAGDGAKSQEAWPATNDPLVLYGDELRFSVFRNGEAMGSHIVKFNRDGDDLVVHTDFEIAVDFLFLTAYRYRYDSRARWRGDHLLDLQAVTDDDGEVSVVTARRQQDYVEILGPGGSISAPSPLFPTNHWHAAVVDQTQVLNTITGRVNRVTIADLGAATVETERGGILATHYRYAGDLNTEVWYDSKGRWVKLRFAGEDGSIIEYRCENCLGTAQHGASK